MELEYPLAQTVFRFVKGKKKKDFKSVWQSFGSDRQKGVGRIMNRTFNTKNPQKSFKSEKD